MLMIMRKVTVKVVAKAMHGRVVEENRMGLGWATRFALSLREEAGLRRSVQLYFGSLPCAGHLVPHSWSWLPFGIDIYLAHYFLFPMYLQHTFALSRSPIFAIGAIMYYNRKNIAAAAQAQAARGGGGGYRPRAAAGQQPQQQPRWQERQAPPEARDYREHMD